MASEKNIPRLIPHELIQGLRLSKPLPNTNFDSEKTDEAGYTEIQIVHGEEFACLGYLVCKRFHPQYKSGYTAYHIYTTVFSEAARLASLDEKTLKQAYKLPEPQDHDS
jgi:hypothetical protein